MTSFAGVRLQTERLVLRPTRPDDAAAMFAMFSDPRVARYLSWPAWTSIDKAHERIAKDLVEMAAGTYLRLALESRDDGRMVGECSLFNLMPQCRRAEIGYSMMADAWGRGWMTEALTALLDHGFSAMDLNRVEADIDPRNEGSARSLERLGFSKEGHLRERWIVAGEVSDSALYGLLAAEWHARRAGATTSP